MKVIIIINKVILFFSIFFIISCSRGNSDTKSGATWQAPDEVQAIAVETLAIEHTKLIKTIVSSGLVRGTKEAWVVSEAQGIITKTSLKLGERVKKDQAIVELENDLQTLTLDLNKEQLKKAENDLVANRAAFNNGNISKATYDQYRINYLQAETRFKQSILDLDKTFLKVPFNGEVALLDSSIIEGNYLSRGTRVAKIVDLDRLQVELPMGERQVDLIETGAKATIVLDFNGESVEYMGEVTAIGSGADEISGSFPVVVTWENDQVKKIRSGFSAVVEIETKGDATYVVVPVDSLVIRNRVEGVFIEKDGKALFREVKTGLLYGGRSVIKEGLKVGDNLIISGLSSIGNEYPVNAMNVGDTGDWE